MTMERDPLDAAAEHAELLGVVLQALERAEKPMTAAAVRKSLPKPYMKPLGELGRALDELVASGRAFALGKESAPKYTARDPRAAIGAVAPGLIAGAILSKAELKKRLARLVPGFSADAFDAWVGAELGRGALFNLGTTSAPKLTSRDPGPWLDDVVARALADGPLPRPKLAAKVKQLEPGLEAALPAWVDAAIARGLVFEHPGPKAGATRLGLEPPPPPDPRPLLAKVLKELRLVLEKGAAQGFSPRALVETLVAEVGVELGGVPSSAAAEPDPADDQRLVLEALRELAAEKPQGSLLSVRDLRLRVALDKERFDRAALALSASRRAVLHYHDFPASLSDEEREGLVRDARGKYYVGIALRAAT